MNNHTEREIREGVVVFDGEPTYRATFQAPHPSGGAYVGEGKWLLEKAFYPRYNNQRRTRQEMTARWKRVNYFDSLDDCRAHVHK